VRPVRAFSTLWLSSERYLSGMVCGMVCAEGPPVWPLRVSRSLRRVQRVVHQRCWHGCCHIAPRVAACHHGLGSTHWAAPAAMAGECYVCFVELPSGGAVGWPDPWGQCALLAQELYGPWYGCLLAGLAGVGWVYVSCAAI
jgi:hypothetical protein